MDNATQFLKQEKESSGTQIISLFFCIDCCCCFVAMHVVVLCEHDRVMLDMYIADSEPTHSSMSQPMLRWSSFTSEK